MHQVALRAWNFWNSGSSVGIQPSRTTGHPSTNTFGYSDTLSWTKGRHNLKFGFNFLPYQNNTLYDFYVNGDFFFYGSNTSVGSGNEFADFLFGAPDDVLSSRHALLQYPQQVLLWLCPG